MYQLPALETLITLLLYVALIMKIGMTRGKLNLAPTLGKGDEAFERLCRIQVNTGEQLVIFLPALWIFAMYVSTSAASLLWMVWMIGRVLYWRGYAQSFEKRTVGFMLTIFSSILLLLGGLIGVVASFLHVQ